MDNLLRVTEILRLEGIVDFSRVPPDIMRRAQAFGTAAHKTTELWDKKTLDVEILDPNLLPRLEAWKKFLHDYNITIDPSEIEVSFTSLKWGFRGTPDRWPFMGKKRRVIDLKTSTQMYAATELQTAGYAILLEEAGYPVHDERWGLQLLEDGKYKVEPYKNKSDKTCFLSARNMVGWKLEHGIIRRGDIQ